MIKRSRYPKLHVAESTVNRILNVSARIQPVPSVTVPPPVPPVEAQGAALDAKLNAPPAPVAMPEGADGAVQTAMLTGEDPIAAAVLPGQDSV